MDWDDAYAIRPRSHAWLAQQPRGRPQGQPDLARQDEADGRRFTPVFGWLVDYFKRAGRWRDQDQQADPPEGQAEIVFVSSARARGFGCHIGAVLAATDFVMPGIGSSIRATRTSSSTSKSVIADNCSSTLRARQPGRRRWPAWICAPWVWSLEEERRAGGGRCRRGGARSPRRRRSRPGQPPRRARRRSAGT